jgi:hypothetical protein
MHGFKKGDPMKPNNSTNTDDFEKNDHEKELEKKSAKST